MKMRIIIVFLLLMSAGSAFCQHAGEVFTGRVVDAETGEPLPYVHIKAHGQETLANVEGDFSLKAEPTDTVSFRLVGFQVRRLCLKDLQATVRLSPLATVMNELEVRGMPVDDILKKLVKKINREHKRGEKLRTTYFYRSSVTDSSGCEMLEAFIDAKSAINIRNMYLISGISRDGYKGAGSEIGLRETNIHRLLELGPATWDARLWTYALCPFEDYWKTKYSYDCSATRLKGDDGGDIYKLVLTLKENLKGTPAEWHIKRHGQLVEGTFYVEAGTLNLLRMDANVRNTFQLVRRRGLRTVEETKLEIHADYERHRNVDEVSRISMSSEGEHMKFNCFLFDVKDMEDIPGRGDRKRAAIGIGKNLISALEKTNFDAPYWDMYNVVKRTADEERALFGYTLAEAEAEDNAFAADTVGTDNEKLRDIWQRLWISSRQMAQEKVYVHLDNTSYRLGDAIWFAAYVHDTHRKRPSQQSGVLYVELLNQNGFLVERKLVELKNGRGHGNFILNKQIQYAGFYELRAYTRWQLGFGTSEREHPEELSRYFIDEEKEHEFFRDYDKLYSRVFPVYDSIPGDDGLWHTMTPRPTLYRQKKDRRERRLSVSFFPEGGHLVAGKQNEVAFEAVWDDGEWAEGELQWGDIPVKTTNRGRGRFFVMPMTEEPRQLTFVPKEGKPVSVEMPAAEPFGVVLHVGREADNWLVNVSCTDNLSPEHLGLTIMNEGKLCYFRPLSQPHSVFRIPSDSLPQGVCQATVFSDEGFVFADRLFFSWHKGQEKPSIVVEGLKDSYAPFEKVELKIRRTAANDSAADRSAVVSVAVRDGEHIDSTYDNASILAEMLLASEIKGFVPDPSWFFQEDDEEHRDALDLLLLTQGWRRFRWETSLRGNPEVSSPEKSIIISGKVYGVPPETEEEKKGEVKWALHTEAVNLQSMKHTHLIDAIHADGRFSFSLPRTSHDFVLFMEMMRRKAGKDIKEQKDRTNEVTADGQLGKKISKRKAKKLEREMEKKKQMAEASKMLANNPNFQITCHMPYPRFVQPYTFYQTRLASGTITQPKPAFAGFKDKYPTLLMSDLEAENKIKDYGLRLRMFDAIALFSTNDFDAANEMRYGINRFRRNYANMHLVPEDSTYAPKYLKSYPKTVVGDHIFDHYELDEYLGVGAIENYVVYTDANLREPPRGASPRGEPAKESIVTIAQYPYRDGFLHHVSTPRSIRVPGFAVADKFYNPDYSRFIMPEGYIDHRRTLYWNPSLSLDKDGKARIVFCNNGSPGSLSIEAEGQAPDGTLLWSK